VHPTMSREPLRFAFNLWLLLLAGVLFAPRAGAAGIQELAATTKPSVVLLTISDAGGRKVASGTGFFVSADGKIVTNHHVIEGAVKVTASLADGRKIECTGVLADDEEKDLAIVKIPGEGYPPLTLGNSRSLRPGDEVVVIGSPLGLSGTVSAGIVSALRNAGEEDEEDPSAKRDSHTKSWGIQVTAAISPGSSGSPIMTPAGEVVAVAVGAITGGQALNFGIPIEEVKTLLARATGKPEAFTRGTTSAVRKNLAISAVFFAVLVLVYFGVKRYDRYKQRRRAGGAIRRAPPS
jgi:S1-C subfamily serine protease